jgi:asparagine synthase (glutamine-hydrolysing)
LYYFAGDAQGDASADVRFAFASELKGLIAHRALQARMTVSMDSVISYLLNDYIVGERCIYSNIRRLPPGSAFTYQLSSTAGPAFRHWRFWEPTFGADSTATAANMSLNAAADEMLQRFERSVRMRLMSDVPLGVFVSGGLDSAAVVAMMTRMLPRREIKTFCIGFNEPSFDEAPYARIVADHFGTNHHVRQFTASDMLAQLPAILQLMDEPYADPSILPVSLLSQFAREHVTVALAGDGGDEIFVGYDPFRAVWPARACRRLVPSAIRRGVLEPRVNAIPASDGNLPAKLKLSRFLRGLAVPEGVQAPVWMGAFSLDQLRRLLPDFCSTMSYDEAYPEALQAYDRVATSKSDSMTATIDFFQRFYLPDDILVKVDRASMAHSLEVRCPMLDRSMAEFANGLPVSFLFRNGQTKRLLRRMAQKPGGLNIPKSIIERKKKGFGIPLGRWIRKELREEFERSLIHDWPRALGMFDRSYIEELHARHINRTADHYKELWALFVLSRWVSRDKTRSNSASCTMRKTTIRT